MRRRRQKNTLLPKMIGLAVLINAILLPILARFGAFKSIGGPQRITEVELVRVPPTPKPPAPPKKTPRKQAAKPHPSAPKAASRTAPSRRAPGPPPVRVVAGGPSANGAGSGGDNGITTSDAPPSPPPPPAPPPAPPVSPPSPAPPPVVPPPAPPPPPPPPPPAPPPPPRVPTLTAAVPLSQPRPSIPDDLRDSDLNTAFDALFTIHPDGTATIKVVSGTGNSTLDALALDAAKRWTFRPATRDGRPVESYLRLRVEFTVDS